MPPEDIAVMEVDCEVLKVKVGTLTIEAAAGSPGQPMHSYRTKILFDGKKPPIGIRRVVLTIDYNDVIRVEIHGYPREAE